MHCAVEANAKSNNFVVKILYVLQFRRAFVAFLFFDQKGN